MGWERWLLLLKVRKVILTTTESGKVREGRSGSGSGSGSGSEREKEIKGEEAWK
jgi:hypothetical protein